MVLLLGLTTALVATAATALSPTPLAVDTGTITRGPLRVTVTGTGRTRVKQRHVVSAAVSGYIPRLPWKAGDVVRRGEEIATVSAAPSPLQDGRTRAELAAREQAARATETTLRAEVERARLVAEQASRELGRTTTLAESGMVAPQQLDNARLEARSRQQELAMAQLNVERAQAEVAVARAARGSTTAQAPGTRVLSPVAGRVMRVLREDEGVVQAGTPLVEVGDPAELEFVVEVLTTEAVQVRPGAAVEVVQWGGQLPLSGTVRVVEPSAFTKVSALGIEEQKVNVIIEPSREESGWRALGDGYQVEARIIVRQDETALKAPVAAVFRKDRGWAVFTVADGRARLKVVQVGESNGAHVEVVSGLSEFERVVLYPSDKVFDEVRVEEQPSH
jgi:HlyD family secretion protein